MKLKDFSVGMKNCKIMVSNGKGHIWNSIDRVPDENQNWPIHLIRVCPNGELFITLEEKSYCYICYRVIYHKKEQIEESDVIQIYDNKYEARSFCDKQNAIEEYDNENEHLYYYPQEREIDS